MQIRQNTRFTCWLIIGWLTLAAALSFGQTTGANLVGTVVDASGAGVPKATIIATNTATGVQFTTNSNASGDYRINNLPVGMYDVNVTAPGFTAVKQTGVEAQLNVTATVNFKVEVGAVSTSLTVEAAAAAIDTTTAQVQNVFEAKAIGDLPIASTGLGVL